MAQQKLYSRPRSLQAKRKIGQRIVIAGQEKVGKNYVGLLARLIRYLCLLKWALLLCLLSARHNFTLGTMCYNCLTKIRASAMRGQNSARVKYSVG